MVKIHVGDRIASGAEHYVYGVDSAFHPSPGKQVAKVPNPLGAWWQEMESTLAQSDLDFLKRYLIPVIETEVVNPIWEGDELVDPSIVHVDGRSESVPYILVQSFIENLQPIELFDLKEAEILDKVRAIWEKAGRLYKDHDRAVDFAGMDALLSLMRNFFRSKINIAITNLHLTENDEVELLDTRLFNLKGNKLFMNMYLRLLAELQFELLGILIREYDPHVPARPLTSWSLVPKVVARLLMWVTESRRP